MARMNWQGGIQLVTGAALGFSQIVVDRLREAIGAALPRTEEQVAHASVVNRLLREHAPAGWSPLGAVQAVALPGIEFESSNCKNFLIELEHEPSPGGPHPETAYVKLPCDEIATRIFGNVMGFWALECFFCRDVAAMMPIRVPRVYAVAQEGARFVLLLENLQEVPGARLFLNRDMAKGTTVDRARMCLSTLARLHAAFWDWSVVERERLLPIEHHSFLAPARRAQTRWLNAISISPARRAAPDDFPQELARTCRHAIEKWDLLLAAWYAAPLTLVHGDSHLANFFEYSTAGGPEMGMIDFQAVHWSAGIRDVQYFLINSLESDLLAASEEALLGHYLGELAGHGVDLSPAKAHAQYRAFSFQTLMTAVVPLGLGALTERNETVLTILRRSVAAVERWDFPGWLEALR